MSMPLPISRRRIKIFLAQEQFDVVHVQVPYSPFMAGRLVQAVPKQTAVIGTFHILPYSGLVTLANRALALANRRSGKRFDSMLAVSAPARQFADRIYGYRSEVLPNPIHLAKFTVAESTSSDTNIVFLGRLVARKGVMQLLEAIDYLRKYQLYQGDFKVYIGGKGELLGELAAFVQANGLSEQVELKGFIPEEEKAQFLCQADIAVYPSVAGESFGIVLLEAMAAARGVVLAGNNPGYASVMQPYPDQIFDPRNPKGFAEVLAWQLNHPAARGRSAELQHEYVQHFDVNEVGARLIAIYAHALQSRTQS